MFQHVVAGVDAQMRIEKENIDAVKFHAIDVSFRRHVEHGVEIDEWLIGRTSAALAD